MNRRTYELTQTLQVVEEKTAKTLRKGVSRSVQRARLPRYQEVISLSSAPATGWIRGITHLILI